MKLSIICCTQAEYYALPYLAMMANLAEVCGAELILVTDRNLELNVFYDKLVIGTFEDGIKASSGDYVLQLNDDECASTAMTLWLWNEEYSSAKSWMFPRFNLWVNDKSAILTPPYFPDYRLRLVSNDNSLSPAEIAPVAIENHKFIARTYSERKLLADANPSEIDFLVPEDLIKEAEVAEFDDGFIPWKPKSRSVRAIY
jgi:hypothetical protein